MTRRVRGAPDLPSRMSNPRVVGSSMASVQGQGKRVEPCGLKRSAALGMPVSRNPQVFQALDRLFAPLMSTLGLNSKAAEVVSILFIHYLSFQGYRTVCLSTGRMS